MKTVDYRFMRAIRLVAFVCLLLTSTPSSLQAADKWQPKPYREIETVTDIHEPNTAGLRRVLKSAQEKRVSIKVMPGMNHLFQKCVTGDPEEFFKSKETIDPKLCKSSAIGWSTIQLKGCARYGRRR